MGFFMAWFELHIRNCGAVQWLFTIWGREKAVRRPSGAVFHSPIRRSHRWLKALQAAATAGPAGHILEKEMYFSERKKLKNPLPLKKLVQISPVNAFQKRKFSNFLLPFSSFILPWKSIKAPLIHAFLSSNRTSVMFGLVYHAYPVRRGKARIIPKKGWRWRGIT